MSQTFSFTAYSSGGATQPQAAAHTGDGAAGPPEYTLSGILHYLQSEWRRYERDRNAWEIERAELRARIALLEGERRGIEHVRTDLLRRIKMLEYALRQERSKGAVQQPAQQPPAQGQSAPAQPSAAQSTPVKPTKTLLERESGNSPTSDDPTPSAANVRLPPGVKDARARTKFREYLQQCLQEISYLTNPTTLNPLSDHDVPRPKLNLDEESQGPSFEARAPAKTDEKAVGNSTAKDTPAATAAASTTADPAATSTAPAPAEVSSPKNVPDVQLWTTKGVIRAHFDMVRALAFDTRNAGLFSSSDDYTIKYWSVRIFSNLHGQTTPAEFNAVNTLTLRGHTKAVTCLAYSRVHDMLFSGGLDATVRFWKLPARPKEKHASMPPVDGPVFDTLDGVWSLALVSGDSMLVAASSDGYVRMYDVEKASLVRSWDYDGAAAGEKRSEGPVPTSVTACPANERVVAVAYSNAVVKLFSIEDGSEVRTIHADATYDGTPATQVNMVIAHPTLPLLATAHEDNYIHTFSMESGQKVMSLHAHASSVASIAIDPSGLTLLSGSQAGSVRFWDIVEDRAGTASGSNNAGSNTPAATTQGAVCFQEVRAHEPRSNEGVLVVAFHPSAPYVATAGADGNVRILG
ncbi:1,2-dihydroxy-3-keto-5-methylthiopentene dioxygenase [Malassezia cuniculi]|uniref:1,2-dihydroxy-3-keto-5-methylthiopentene dioxygenase n=1 Tax=Malassezia cuniculi TaxID=948313 RepID=A0AAF0EU14_9BASI|nr:1,2-dihydroxy-3-keto-5-methylthiopentene dioxygenase [Malassezia cuniculi]